MAEISWKTKEQIEKEKLEAEINRPKTQIEKLTSTVSSLKDENKELKQRVEILEDELNNKGLKRIKNVMFNRKSETVQ